jgi:DNA-binding NtrC family response regulator
MTQILIVDDDLEIQEKLVEILKNDGYSPDIATSATEAIEKTKQNQYKIILLDYMLPDFSGLEALNEIKRFSPKSKVIMITAFATIENAVEAIKKGASEYVTKPFKIDVLLMLIKQVLEELRFEEGIKKLELDETLSSLSNVIRRKTIRLLELNTTMRLMELTRNLEIEDHTKVVFHLKSLKESGIIEQDNSKAYSLTKEGTKIYECLNILENYLSEQ